MNIRKYKHFQVDRDERGVAHVTIDVQDRPLNIFDREVMLELGDVVNQVEAADTKLVVFRSGKSSGFFAGADVSVIAEMDESSEAKRLLEKGQQLFHRIERMRVPTVAVIHGPCLGGGLEFALACRYRVGRADHDAKIGLPEIKLGLIPGWGGTVRLTRQIGTAEALKMILTGKHVDCHQAAKLGLLDKKVSSDEQLDEFLNQILNSERRPVKKGGPLWQRLVDQTGLGRWLMLRLAERSIASKSKHYPALPAAIRAVRAGGLSAHNGLVAEREEFVRLLQTPTCRNLLSLFFAREKARTVSTWSTTSDQMLDGTLPLGGSDAIAAWEGTRLPTLPASSLRPSQGEGNKSIQRVGVIGAGTMGAGIGQLAATRGFDVVFKEIDEDALSVGKRRVDRLIDKYAAKKRLTDRQTSELRSLVTFTIDEAPLADCDLVIEAAAEKPEVKADIFAMLDRVVDKDTILASNTSSLSIAQMAKATGRPEQVAGLHFFNPVHRMELVEVVHTDHTDASTLASLVGFTKSLGKTPVVTADSPGFLVNRVLFPYLAQAVVMVGDGYTASEIDRQIRRFGMPMGPLELMDQVGIDIAMHVADSLGHIVPGLDFAHQRLCLMVDQGWLGKKSGKGFYDYRDGKKSRRAPWFLRSRGKQLPPLADVPHQDGLNDTQRRLIYPMLNESIRCLQESVVRYPWAIDLGMVLGTGFAPHRGGPLHMVDEIGPAKFFDNVQSLQRKYGAVFTPPELLVPMAKEGRLFFGADSAKTFNCEPNGPRVLHPETKTRGALPTRLNEATSEATNAFVQETPS